MGGMLNSDDVNLRLAVEIIKREFLGWKQPPVELPPDSVIENAARQILGLNARKDDFA